MAKKKPDPEAGDSEGDPTFDMYHLFSRWDFWLLLIFILATLILTVLIILNDHQIA